MSNLKRRRAKKAREAIAFYLAGRARGGPPPDNSFWSAWADATLRGSGDLRKPYSEHPGVYRAVSVIARDMGGVPWHLWQGAEDDKREVLTGPWYDLFADPSPDCDMHMIWALTRTWRLLDGEAFWILRARDGSPLEPRQIPGLLEPVRGGRMKELLDPGTKALIGWELEQAHGRRKLRLRRDQVVHFRLPNPDNPRRGLAPMSAIRRSVRTDVKAHGWNEASLDNGAEPGVILKPDKDAGQVSPTQIDQLRKQYLDHHQGAGNANKPLVLPAGWDLSTLGFSPKDMQFGEQRKWSRFEIASAYGVPLMLMGDMETIHSKESARIVERIYWQNTVVPHLSDEQRVLARQIFLRRTGGDDTASTQDIWIEPDLSGIAALQAEASERRTNAKTDRDLGFSLDEVNRIHALGYEPEQPGGSIGLVPGGLMPVSAMDYSFEDDLDPLPPVEGGDGPPPADQDVQVAEAFVLNGAQIVAALNIVLAVANGELPRDTGIGMLITLFNLSPEQAEAIMGSAGTDTPTTPNPKPAGEGEGGEKALHQAEHELRAVRLETRCDTTPDAARVALARATGRAPKPTRDRAVLWHQYIRAVQRPGEKKMRVAVLGWMKGIRRQLLKWVEKEGGRDAREISAADVEAWLAERREEWDQGILDRTTLVSEWIAKGSLKRLGDLVGEAPPPMTSPKVLELLDEMGARKVKYVSDTMQRQIRTVLLKGVAKGENITDLQERIKGVMNAGASRSLAIARTETGAVSNGATFVGYGELGIEKHSWLSARDSEVRAGHDIDGEVVTVGTPFSNGLLYPHDPSGDAGSVVNCRCNTVPEDDEIEIV